MEKTGIDKKKIQPADLVAAAMKIPSVRVNREKFITAQFDKLFGPETVLSILENGPHAAGVSKEVIHSLTRSVIRHETALVSLASGAAGIPGGWAMAATIPADMVQYHAAMLRVAQKMAYLHDWAELVPERHEDIDDSTKNVLLVFLGAMYGVKVANEGITYLAKTYSAQLTKAISSKPLTQGAVYPIVKKVSTALGIQMNKQIFGQVTGKAVPLVGAVISGGLTFFSFRGMSSKLHQHLASQLSQKTANLGQ
jgi:hypothetical protein